MSKISTQTVQTMSSLELVGIINELRQEGAPELRHDNFMAKIEKHPGIASPKFLGHVEISIGNGATRKSKCYHLPKREAELMVMSESLEVQTRVYDRMTALEQQALGSSAQDKPKRRATNTEALDKLRTANALKLATETAALLCAKFPSLSQNAQQVIYAKIINPIAGDEVLSLPRVEEPLMLAGKVGELLGVSGNKIGRLANQHNMKTDEYGEYRLDKSQHSVKQMDVFHYNAKAVERFRELLATEPVTKLEVVS